MKQPHREMDYYESGNKVLEDGELSINLDHCSHEELEELTDTYQSLSRYCKLRLSAEKDRLAGRIRLAIDSDNEMERIYSALPPAFRW